MKLLHPPRDFSKKRGAALTDYQDLLFVTDLPLPVKNGLDLRNNVGAGHEVLSHQAMGNLLGLLR